MKDLRQSKKDSHQGTKALTDSVRSLQGILGVLVFSWQKSFIIKEKMIIMKNSLDDSTNKTRALESRNWNGGVRLTSSASSARVSQSQINMANIYLFIECGNTNTNHTNKANHTNYSSYSFHS